MQVYDLMMLLVLVGATIFGAWKGMAWQVASMSSLVLSYFVALKFSDKLAPYISQQQPWNRFAAMAILYVLTSLAIWMAFRLVADMIDRIKLKDLDRQIGGVFGLAKGILLCVILTFFAVTLSSQFREMALASRSGYYIAELIERAENVMPPEAKQVLGPYLKKLDEGLAPAKERKGKTKSPALDESPSEDFNPPSGAPRKARIRARSAERVNPRSNESEETSPPARRDRRRAR